MVASEVIQLVAVYGLFVVQQFWEAHEIAWCCYLSFYKLNQRVNSYPMCCQVFPCLSLSFWRLDLMPQGPSSSLDQEALTLLMKRLFEPDRAWWMMITYCYGHITMQLYAIIISIWFIWYHIIINGSVDWKLPVLRGFSQMQEYQTLGLGFW